jgi:hypothetical protein
MTEVLDPSRIFRPYKVRVWWTRTAVTVSSWVLPLFLASTFMPVLSWLIGKAFPSARSILVVALKLLPTGRDTLAGFILGSALACSLD